MDLHSHQRTRTILIAEDEALLRLATVAAFELEGWNVLATATADNALDLIKSTPHIDVIFTDIDLRSALSGWDVAETGRSAHGDIGVIYTSAVSRDHARRLKGSFFFEKPYRLEEIIETSAALADVKGTR